MKKTIIMLLLFTVHLATAQKVYTKDEVDTSAELPGGYLPWVKFVGQNFRKIEEPNQEPAYDLEFVVLPKGSITNIKVIDGKGTLNEKEAIRVMKLSPKWTPATKNGKAVASVAKQRVRNPYWNENDDRYLAPAESPVKDYPISVPKAPVDESTIYNTTAVEVKPDYPGGLQQFYDFFYANAKMPEVSNEYKKNGKITIEFIVEKDGSLTEYYIRKDLGRETGKEAIRVIQSAKHKWIPGQLNGKAVRVRYQLPIDIAPTQTQYLKK